MVMECGMSHEIGPVYVSEEKSAETRKMVDSEITHMLKDAYSRVTTMLVLLSFLL
jgi:ATP-dependent Zn protease